MNKHSFNVLEFDKLKELILANIVIDDNREVIENLEPYKDLSALNNELKTVKDFMDLLSFDGGFEAIGLRNINSLMEKIKLIGTYLEVEELWDINVNLRTVRIFKSREASSFISFSGLIVLFITSSITFKLGIFPIISLSCLYFPNSSSLDLKILTVLKFTFISQSSSTSR